MPQEVMGKAHKQLPLLCFIILFFICILFSIIFGIETYVYDSNSYWTYADATVESGSFNLLLYPETFRGCLFPLLVLAFKSLFRGIWGWRILSSLMVSCLFGVFLPRIFRFSISTVRDVIRTIIAELVFFFFWGNFVQYPLSDLPAVFFLSAGIYFLIKIINYRNDNDIKHFSRRFCLSLVGAVSGMCMYLAYNTRVAFLYGVILALLYFVIVQIKKRRFSVLIISMIGIVTGLIIAALPQAMINKQYVGVYSPKVYTEKYTKYQEDLQTRQVYWGLEFQRYETYIGNKDVYEKAGVHFDNPVGKKIIENEKIETKSFSIKDLISIFIKYPLDTIGMYTRHLISLITPIWNEIYITNIYTNKMWVIIPAMIIWYIAVIGFFSLKEAGRLKFSNSVFILSLIIPSALQLFGAPELRFFLSVYMVLYPFVFYLVDFRLLLVFIKKKWKVITLGGLFIFILWVTIISDTLSNNRLDTLLISGNYENRIEISNETAEESFK